MRRPRSCAEEGDETTQTFSAEEADEALGTLDDLGVEGPALVVRSGGGRSGESFVPQDERTTIGRSPDCGVFLDDVTVSRRHAVLVQRASAAGTSRTREASTGRS